MTDLDDLDNKIKKAQHLDEKSIRQQKQKDADKNAWEGMHAGFEFVGSIFVPAFIGYWIDDYFGTTPAFLLTLFFLGVCTAFYNIYRLSQNLGASVGYSELHKQEKDAKTSPTDAKAPEIELSEVDIKETDQKDKE